jgi:hypothetical protein
MTNDERMTTPFFFNAEAQSSAKNRREEKKEARSFVSPNSFLRSSAPLGVSALNERRIISPAVVLHHGH